MDKFRSKITKKLNPLSDATVVTVAVGQQFIDLANSLAQNVKFCLGYKLHIITEDELIKRKYPRTIKSIYKLKLDIFDIFPNENIVFIDADCRILSKWDISKFIGGDFVAVRDYFNHPNIITECDLVNINNIGYFNSGIYFANRSKHAKLLAEASEFMANKDLRFPDQTALNWVLQKYKMNIKYLDRRYNWIHFGDTKIGCEFPIVVAHATDHNKEKFELNLQKQLKAPKLMIDDTRWHLTGKYVLNSEIVYLRSDGSIDSRKLLYWWPGIDDTIIIYNPNTYVSILSKSGDIWKNNHMRLIKI